MSTINTAIPATNAALQSAPIRANFAAAANDIDANAAAAAAALSAANTHAASTDNPHATTAAQVGADATGTAAAAVAAHVALGDPHAQYVLETTTVNGQALSGNVTVTNIAGNAATVTTNANLTGPVTSTGNATAIANGAITNAMLANGAVANLAGTNTGDNAVNSLYSGLISNATHTGDATGATALTLATVNSNVGSFTNASITVNAKGLITAAATGSGGSGGLDNYTAHVLQGII
jgi:hypothetical protein